MKKLSFLEKAKQVHRPHHRRIAELNESELLDLALAYFSGEVAPNQCSKAIGRPRGGSAVYTIMCVTLRNAILDGSVKLKKLL